MNLRLVEAAQMAGLHDPDLLKLANADYAPALAVSDLRQRYPGAFSGEPGRLNARIKAIWQQHIVAGETLAGIASEFGAVSPDIIAHARKDIPARQAMEALRTQFPASFKPVFNARTATREEAEIEWKRLQSEQARQERVAQEAQDLARMEREMKGRK